MHNFDFLGMLSEEKKILEVTVLNLLLQVLHSFDLLAILREEAEILKVTLLDFLLQVVHSFDLLAILSEEAGFRRSLSLIFSRRLYTVLPYSVKEKDSGGHTPDSSP